MIGFGNDAIHVMSCVDPDVMSPTNQKKRNRIMWDPQAVPENRRGPVTHLLLSTKLPRLPKVSHSLNEDGVKS